VITGNENNTLAMAGPAQQFLHHRILGRRPVNTPVHGPEIDNIPDQKDVVRGIFTQKVEELIRLARPRAKVNIREKQGANLGHGAKI
jgi:hypothetical protein